MASCPSCGAAGVPWDAPCPKCGANPVATGGAVPDFELDVRARPAPKPPPRKVQQEEDAPLELAVDPRVLLEERSSDRAPSGPASGPQAYPTATVHRGGASSMRAPAPKAALAPQPAVGDLAFDARLLADFGDPPGHWILSPLYAWRVLKRQQALKQVLVGRREEAARTTTAMEDALVAFAERVRQAAEKQTAYGAAFEAVTRAEELLRSRDQVLAAEQDAQKARLAQVDARLSALEAELAKAHDAERAAATELSAAQRALAREEAKLKRAELELRSAEQRESAGGRPG